MPTIIDSLLVKLRLDSQEFIAGKLKVDTALKDTGKVASDTGGKLKKSGKEASEGFETAAKSAVKFLAILGGTVAIKRFVENTIESNAALERFSRNLQQGVEEVSAWSNAAELAGGSAEGLQGSMDMLSRSQTELMLTGQSSIIPYLSSLGVSLTDTFGKARPVNELMLDLSERFSSMDRTTANNMGRMMGFDQGTMQLLLKGRGEVELMIKRQREFGAVSKHQAEEASRLREGMVRAKQGYEALGRELLSRATPALEKIGAVFANIGEWARTHSGFVEGFLAVIATGLAAIGLSAVTINPVATLILGLAAAIGILWDDYKVWKEGGETLIPWDKWEPGIAKAIAGVKSLARTVMDAGYRMAAFMSMTYKFYSGDTKGARADAEAMMRGMPTGGDTQGAASKSAPAGMDPVAYFKSRGWSDAQSAGIVANLRSESGLRANAVGDNGKAFGIAQWHPDRQANFKKWSGKDIRESSLEDQLAFVHYELTQGSEQRAGSSLRQAITAQRAGEIVSAQYERPADAAGEAGKRGRLARSIAMGIPGASSAAMSASAASVASAGSTQVGGETRVETNIGEVKVYTAATDAPGIARDMGLSLDNYITASQANYGLN